MKYLELIKRMEELAYGYKRAYWVIGSIFLMAEADLPIFVLMYFGMN